MILVHEDVHIILLFGDFTSMKTEQKKKKIKIAKVKVIKHNDANSMALSLARWMTCIFIYCNPSSTFCRFP